MMNCAPDATGWIDELTYRQGHILTPHAGIAAVALVVLMILSARLLLHYFPAGEPMGDWPEDE